VPAFARASQRASAVPKLFSMPLFGQIVTTGTLPGMQEAVIVRGQREEEEGDAHSESISATAGAVTATEACPACASSITEDSKTCRKCGRKREDRPYPASPVTPGSVPKLQLGSGISGSAPPSITMNPLTSRISDLQSKYGLKTKPEKAAPPPPEEGLGAVWDECEEELPESFLDAKGWVWILAHLGRERCCLQASRVCRLWHRLTNNASLWAGFSKEAFWGTQAFQGESVRTGGKKGFLEARRTAAESWSARRLSTDAACGRFRATRFSPPHCPEVWSRWGCSNNYHIWTPNPRFSSPGRWSRWDWGGSRVSRGRAASTPGVSTSLSNKEKHHNATCWQKSASVLFT